MEKKTIGTVLLLIFLPNWIAALTIAGIIVYQLGKKKSKDTVIEQYEEKIINIENESKENRVEIQPIIFDKYETTKDICKIACAEITEYGKAMFPGCIVQIMTENLGEAIAESIPVKVSVSGKTNKYDRWFLFEKNEPSIKKVYKEEPPEKKKREKRQMVLTSKHFRLFDMELERIKHHLSNSSSDNIRYEHSIPDEYMYAFLQYSLKEHTFYLEEDGEFFKVIRNIDVDIAEEEEILAQEIPVSDIEQEIENEVMCEEEIIVQLEEDINADIEETGQLLACPEEETTEVNEDSTPTSSEDEDSCEEK